MKTGPLTKAGFVKQIAIEATIFPRKSMFFINSYNL